MPATWRWSTCRAAAPRPDSIAGCPGLSERIADGGGAPLTPLGVGHFSVGAISPGGGTRRAACRECRLLHARADRQPRVGTGRDRGAPAPSTCRGADTVPMPVVLPWLPLPPTPRPSQTSLGDVMPAAASLNRAD